MQKPAMFFKIIAVFLKNMAGFYVVHKGVCLNTLPSFSPFKPEVVAAQRQDTSDQGCQKIKYLGGEASPASGMEGIKPHLQLLRPWGILIGNDFPYLTGAGVETDRIAASHPAGKTDFGFTPAQGNGGIRGILLMKLSHDQTA